MPAAFSSCTGIYMQTFYFFIKNYFQNVGMATDEQPRRLSVYFTLHLRGIATGISTDMGHPHLHRFALKAQVFRELRTDSAPVNVSIYATQGFKGRQSCGHIGTEIAGMPDLITGIEMPEYGIV
ncbi:hypothetical protein D9M68_613590 [compost metagenome]